jgi:hypothetical protein
MYSTTTHPFPRPKSVLATGHPGNTGRPHLRGASMAPERYQTASKLTAGSAAAATRRRQPPAVRPVAPVAGAR